MERHISLLLHSFRAIALLAASLYACSSYAIEASNESTDISSWRASASERVPRTEGCYKIQYPELEWIATKCEAPFTPALGGGGVEVVGGKNGYDYFVSVKGQPYIDIAKGGFGSVVTTGVSSDGIANNYTVQLNTNGYPSNACQHHAGCQGWNQAVYWSHYKSFGIIYGLIGYGKGCPGNPTWPQTNNDCLYAAYRAVPFDVDVRDLGAINFDMRTFYLDSAKENVIAATVYYHLQGYAVTAPDYFGLLGNWKYAEFNVFGDGSGHMAVFDANTSMYVDAWAYYDDIVSGVNCTLLGTTTLESSNLNLVPASCNISGNLAEFKQSN